MRVINFGSQGTINQARTTIPSVQDPARFSNFLFVSLVDVIVDRFVMFREVMLVFESSPADLATKAWLDTAFHSFVQIQRFFPFVRFSAGVAQIARTKHKNR